MNLANPQSAIRNPQSMRLLVGVYALLAALILSPLAAHGEGLPAEAVNVFHCTFGNDWDVDYDAWPDRWFRKTISTAPLLRSPARRFASCRASATSSKRS
jgi:hypothetical protein